MSHSDHPPRAEVPESTVSELHALYREAAHAEPDAMLDRKILDAARAELRGTGATKAWRQPPWWKSWLPAASALAIALVGVSVTWRVMDQQERDLRQEMKAAEAVQERSVAAPASVAPAQGGAETAPLPSAPAPLAGPKRRAEPTVLKDKDAPPRVQEPGATSAPAAPAPMVPGIAEEAMKKGGRSEKEDLRERRDASAVVGTAAGAASSPARQAGKLEAGRPGAASSNEAAADSLAAPAATSAAKSAAAPAVDASSPEAWLKQIRELRAAGRGAEAAQSLARFRERYPDYALPGDLLNLK